MLRSHSTRMENFLEEGNGIMVYLAGNENIS